MKSLYTQEFYDQTEKGALESAHSILNLLYELYLPASVVDFGCGRGAWLAVARLLGSQRLTGLDGNWIEQEKLLHPDIEFVPTDFCEAYAVPGKFDLCISVEVAEHIEEKHSDGFVQKLCEASEVVLFSAAIPGQGGVHHLNEQWQSYWSRKFDECGFECFDIFRPRVWNLESVEWWYRQNTLLYVGQRDRMLDKNKLRQFKPTLTDVVHPRMLDSLAESEGNRIQRLMERLLTKEDVDALQELAQFFRRDHADLSNELIRRAERLEKATNS